MSQLLVYELVIRFGGKAEVRGQSEEGSVIGKIKLLALTTFGFNTPLFLHIHNQASRDR